MAMQEVPAPRDIKFERRMFKRINRSYVVSYVPVKGEDVKSDVSQTKNLSEGGLLFVSDREFKKDVILKIKLRLPEFSDYVILRAQVVDSIKKVGGLMYETRARFIEVEEKVKEAIRRLADEV